MSWIISLVSHGKFLRSGRVELGMHSPITLKNSCFQDSQLDSISECDIIQSVAMSGSSVQMKVGCSTG